MKIYDVAIIGGGPAGLNAAVVLGRCQRKVVLFDTGQPRNLHSEGMHNYLTRDHIPPIDFLHIAHDEIKKYGVEFHYLKVTNAIKKPDGIFQIKDRQEKLHYAKKLLIATGLADKLPDIPGLKECYGKSVFHCPYCDGWEVRHKKIGIYAKNKNGVDLALSLKTWSDNVRLYTDGKKYLKAYQLEQLADHNIEVITKPWQQLQHVEGKIKKIHFKDNTQKACDAIFFVNGFDQQTDLAENLGCRISAKGVVLTNKSQGTNVKGVFVAGDASKDMHFVVVAAAEGAKAGVTINKELQKEMKKAIAPSLQKVNKKKLLKIVK